MPMTSARTSPPSGLRRTGAAAQASKAAIPISARPAVHHVRSRVLSGRIAYPAELLTAPLDPPVERIDVVLAEARRVGYVHRFIRAFADRLHRELEAVLAQKGRDSFRALAREFHVELRA